MPTHAEMLLLDVLQNVSKCEIKDITDRHRYWTADPASNAAFRILKSVRGYRRGECQQCGSAMRKGYRPSVVAFLTTNEIIKVK